MIFCSLTSKENESLTLKCFGACLLCYFTNNTLFLLNFYFIGSLRSTKQWLESDQTPYDSVGSQQTQTSKMHAFSSILSDFLGQCGVLRCTLQKRESERQQILL